MSDIQLYGQSLTGADFYRWNRILSSGGSLPIYDQKIMNGFINVLRDKYLELLEQYRRAHVRLGFVEGPMNDFARLADVARLTGEVNLETFMFLVESLVADFEELGVQEAARV